MDNKNSEEKLNPADVISLMGVYREEWKYRDETYMANVFRFTSLALIITCFPDLINRIGISEDSLLITNVPGWIYHLLGLFCTIIGVLFSISESQRIEKIDDAYYRLMSDFHDKYIIDRLGQNDKGSGYLDCFYSFRLNSILYFAYLIPGVLSSAYLFVDFYQSISLVNIIGFFICLAIFIGICWKMCATFKKPGK